MSGLEILGVAASIIQIADLGARVSVKLSTFYHKVKQANDNIQNLSTDVALTCTVLKQLGDNLQQDDHVKLYSPDAFSVANEIMRECEKVFRQIESAMEDDTSDSVKTSTVKYRVQRAARKLHLVFLEPQLSVLQCNLDRLKSTMLLMLNVIIYAGQVRRQEAEARRQEQKEIIEVLADEQRIKNKRYQQLAKAIESVDTEENPQSGPPSASRELTSFVALTEQDDTSKLDESIPEEFEQYANLIKTLLTSVDEMKLALDNARYRRIRRGVLTIHNRESLSFQVKHGPWGKTACKKLFAGPLFESEIEEMEQEEDKLEILQPEQITYIKVHRKHLLPETVEAYRLPWEWQEDDSNYIIIKQWISEEFQEELFAHTRRLREGQLVTETSAPLVEFKLNDRSMLRRWRVTVMYSFRSWLTRSKYRDTSDSTDQEPKPVLTSAKAEFKVDDRDRDKLFLVREKSLSERRRFFTDEEPTPVPMQGGVRDLILKWTTLEESELS